MPPEPWYHLGMMLAGTELERYDTIMAAVPFYRLAAYCEERLREAEKREEELERMRKK